MVDWGWEVLACWHLLPIWLQLQPLFPFKKPFCQTYVNNFRSSSQWGSSHLEDLIPSRRTGRSRKLLLESVGQYYYITNVQESPESKQQQYQQGETKRCWCRSWRRLAKCYTNFFFRSPRRADHEMIQKIGKRIIPINGETWEWLIFSNTSPSLSRKEMHWLTRAHSKIPNLIFSLERAISNKQITSIKQIT